MGLAEDIAEHVTRFLATGGSHDQLRALIEERSATRFWNLDVEGQARVLHDALSNKDAFQIQLADALQWTQPKRDSAGLVLLALNVARGGPDIANPELFKRDLDWKAWKLDPDLKKIQAVFENNAEVRTAFARAIHAYPNKKHLKQLARQAVEEVGSGSHAAAVKQVLDDHLLNWKAMSANMQQQQFLEALKEDFEFRHAVARMTTYQSAEAKDLASLAAENLRAVPARRWMMRRRGRLIDRLADDPKTAALGGILRELSDEPDEAGWRAVQHRLSIAFADDPGLSSVLWRKMEWPFPFALVLREELKQIESKRGAGGDGLAATATDVSDLAAQMGLVGVSFSGGGIRSATFNLGVLQKVAEFGLLRKIDYLSTVSGGGYIGAWLAGWIKARGVPQVEAYLSPERSPDPRKSSQRPIRFLREFSNYLTPTLGTFSFDTWTMFAVYTRNVLLNQATLCALIGALLLLPRLLALPMMVEVIPKHATDLWMVTAACALLVTSVICMSLNMSHATASAAEECPKPDQAEDDAKQFNDPNSFYGTIRIQIYVVGSMLLGVFLGSMWFWRNIGDAKIPPWDKWWRWAFLLFILLSSLLAFFGGFWRCYELRYKHFGQSYRWWRLLVTALIILPSAGSSLGLLLLYLKIMCWLHGTPASGAWNAEIWGPVMLLTVLVLPGILQIGLMGVDFPDSGREWMSRFRAVCSVYTIYWVAIMSAAVYGPLLIFLSASRAKVWLSGLSVVWVFTTVSSFLAGSSRKTGLDKNGKPTASLLEVLAKVGPPVFVAGLIVLIATLEQLFFAYVTRESEIWNLAYLSGQYWNRLDSWRLGSGHNWILLKALASLSAAGLILAWRVDINEFSMHHFYKNRLVRCYLGASHKNRNPNPFTGFDDCDDFALSSLKATHATPYLGPYPIINTTLNLSAGKQLAWQERKAASFIFTPCFCGFDLGRNSEKNTSLSAMPKEEKLRSCAYRETLGYAQPNGPHLGTAVSISGAAANPNQGYNTSPAVAFLMTMFNVRLGWWVGNPRRDQESKLSGPRFGLAALVSEVLGRTDDRTNFVNLSDGGHFDNMGIYELVRRRCKFILVCDAEQDASYRFGGLGMAIRRCRVDFGARIDIDTAGIVPNPGTHLSDRHCAVGRIQYLDGSIGTLVYIKASLTGDEPKDVVEYGANQPHFPHESTADQWFRESQFESYRALGYHVTDQTLTPSNSWQPWNPAMPSTQPLFSALEKYWYPLNPHLRDGATKHTATLADLFRTIQDTPGLQNLGAQLFPNSGITPASPRNEVEEFYFCMALLQLVEDLYFEFELDRTQWFNDPRIGGWRHLFRVWKDVPMVASTWAAEYDTFREDFQRFWNISV